MFRVNAAERVHDSRPYKSTDQMKHLRSLTFSGIESLRSLRTGDIWLKLVLAIPIRLLISFSHLPSDVNIDPRSVPDQGCAGPVAYVNRGAPPPTLAAKTGVTE